MGVLALEGINKTQLVNDTQTFSTQGWPLTVRIDAEAVFPVVLTGGIPPTAKYPFGPFRSGAKLKVGKLK